MSIFSRIGNSYKKSSLASKIRLSYAIIIVPVVILLGASVFMMYRTNLIYDDMIESVVTASEFSLDFKSDIDYETYMVIAGVKTYDDSELEKMLSDASGVVKNLYDITDSSDNTDRLNSIERYIENLHGYLDKINYNLSTNGTYDDSMLIWENDVQVVTSLIQETFNNYTYYELKDLQVANSENRKNFTIIANVLLALVIVITIAVLILSYYFNSLLAQVTEEQNSLRKAEFLVLQSQINPHFLYNTLDAIIWLAEAGKNSEAVRLVGLLSSFFRTSLGHGKDIVTLREEIEHIRSYLDIQAVRYRDILKFEIDIPEEYHSAQIPKITLQPLVENALYHGIKNKRGGGYIKVYASVDDKRSLEDNNSIDSEINSRLKNNNRSIYIYVEDNGAGISPERLEQVREGIVNKASEETGVYGLYNVNERIRLHFGDEFGLSIDSVEGEYTRSVIKIPHPSAALTPSP